MSVGSRSLLDAYIIILRDTRPFVEVSRDLVVILITGYGECVLGLPAGVGSSILSRDFQPHIDIGSTCLSLTSIDGLDDDQVVWIIQ